MVGVRRDCCSVRAWDCASGVLVPFHRFLRRPARVHWMQDPKKRGGDATQDVKLFFLTLQRFGAHMWCVAYNWYKLGNTVGSFSATVP